MAVAAPSWRGGGLVGGRRVGGGGRVGGRRSGGRHVCIRWAAVAEASGSGKGDDAGGSGKKSGGRSGSKASRKPKGKPKRVRFGASARARVKAPRPDGGKPLAEYFALPFDAYSTLDPELISRLDDGAAPNEAVFRLTLPLDALVQLPCRPSMDVRAEQLPDDGALRLTCVRATIVGDAEAPDAETETGKEPSAIEAEFVEMDELAGDVDKEQPSALAVEIETSSPSGTNSRADKTSQVAKDGRAQGAEVDVEVEEEVWQPPGSGVSMRSPPKATARPPAVLGSPAELRAGIEALDEAFELSWEARIEWSDGRSAAGQDAALRGRVRAKCQILVPPPFSAPPAALIGLTLTATARTVASILLPRVLQEIARDYTGWASGARRQARAGALSDSELMQRDPGLAKPGSANSAVSQSPGNMSDWT